MANQDRDLGRVRSKETNQHKMGRSRDAMTPKMELKGDTNPTKGGGINRSTSKSSMVR